MVLCCAPFSSNMLRLNQGAPERGAVEVDVQVSATSNFHTCDPIDFWKRDTDFLRDGARSLF